MVGHRHPEKVGRHQAAVADGLAHIASVVQRGVKVGVFAHPHRSLVLQVIQRCQAGLHLALQGRRGVGAQQPEQGQPQGLPGIGAQRHQGVQTVCLCRSGGLLGQVAVQAGAQGGPDRPVA